MRCKIDTSSPLFMKKLFRYRLPVAGVLCALLVMIGIKQLTAAAQNKEARDFRPGLPSLNVCNDQ